MDPHSVAADDHVVGGPMAGGDSGVCLAGDAGGGTHLHHTPHWSSVPATGASSPVGTRLCPSLGLQTFWSLHVGGRRGAGGCRAGPGWGSETNQSLSRHGLVFCAARCHPQTRVAPSRLSRRTDIELLGDTRRRRHAEHGLSAVSHTCALRSVRLGQWGGSRRPPQDTS